MECRNKKNRHHTARQYTRQDMTSPSPRSIIRQHDIEEKGSTLQAKPWDDKRKQDNTKGWQWRQKFSKKELSSNVHRDLSGMDVTEFLVSTNQFLRTLMT